MNITEHLNDLERLRTVSPLDWNSPEHNVYEREVGRFTLRLRAGYPAGGVEWEVRHPRAGVVSKGVSDGLAAAKTDAIQSTVRYLHEQHGLLA